MRNYRAPHVHGGIKIIQMPTVRQKDTDILWTITSPKYRPIFKFSLVNLYH